MVGLRYLCVDGRDENDRDDVESVRCLHELMTASFRRYGGPKTLTFHEPTEPHWSQDFDTEQAEPHHGISTRLGCKCILMIAGSLPIINCPGMINL